MNKETNIEAQPKEQSINEAVAEKIKNSLGIDAIARTIFDSPVCEAIVKNLPNANMATILSGLSTLRKLGEFLTIKSRISWLTKASGTHNPRYQRDCSEYFKHCKLPRSRVLPFKYSVAALSFI